ncbi:mechanosensitive ion channel family protein [Marinicella litoralis]|uniref:Small-conductance mechanosensitive channel n=1 Tax=Marinicella litoralis TaxID=644220 RepID=A0A4R6XYT8_9GAMM|nr:mechanosensitive ion channel domain-containing protein [Marinicella litoralis]TDR23809.1 small conductance mechanosensitive channel [Marinicella litoralis]
MAENTENNEGLFQQIKSQFSEYLTNPEMLIDVAQSLVLALLIYWVGKRIAKLVSNMTGKGLTKTGNEVILVNFIKNIIYYVILAAVIVMALGQLGVQTTSLIAVMGAAGLAIGLALKDSLSNLASGVMLVLTRPFKRGDFVDVAGTSGKVTEIKLFSTILQSTDNKKLIIPNGQITSDVIVNYTTEALRRIDLVIGVSYDDDIRAAKKILMETISAHEMVLQEPKPVVMLKDLGASSVDFVVRPWVKTEDYWTVYGDLMEQIKLNIEAGGCSFPYPQTDVHLHQVKES